MQIHELPAQTNAADTDVVAIDNGTTTQKMTVAKLGKKITEDATPAFTSGDSSTATSWTNVAAVTSGLSLKNILNRITTMMKNVRYLYNKLGTTDISSIGDGTATGAIGLFNAYRVVYKSGVISLPSGTGGQTSTRIDISDVLPSGFSTYSAIVLLNTYPLPYVTGSGMTWVSALDNTHLEIANTTTAWSNYNYYITLFCRKN